MTPKEKARELVDNIEDVLGHSDLNVCETEDLDIETRITAKQCAIVCVDWHIKEFIDVYGDDLIENIAYWEEVKKEIELM